MSNMIHIVSLPEHELAIRDGARHNDSLRISAKFLPNPFKVSEFQRNGLTGLDDEVSSWIEKEYEALSGRPISDMIYEKVQLLKWRIINSRAPVHRLYVYCIGGIHRSPYMAERLKVQFICSTQFPIREVRVSHVGLALHKKGAS